ncbi:MAG: hypothetical protein KIG45_06860, partial [Bacteroidales bacterium]|nr:hypothetical protein [Bacteroidales bacterium]
MEREDPLQRLERKEAEKKSNSGLKTVMIIMTVLAVILAGVLAYVWMSNRTLVSQLTLEKEELTEQVQALQLDYENLSSEYDVINSQLDSSREEISQLIDRLKKTQATDRNKIRQYEKELGTLRSIMRSYIVQIDSLNQLNHQLSAEAASARREAAESKKLNAALTQQVETLEGKVSAGSVLKARALRVEAFTTADKKTDRSSRVERLLVSLSLVENELAQRGPVRVYVRVTAPDGSLLSDGRGTTFTLGGNTLEATASREVDYQGAEVELGVYVNNVSSYQKGVYSVEAYTEQSV